MKTKQEITGNWLQRYTKMPLDSFGQVILLTNFNNYVDLFCEQNGIEPARIAISPVCTLTTPSCYSARRQGIDSGRNFTAIGMRK